MFTVSVHMAAFSSWLFRTSLVILVTGPLFSMNQNHVLIYGKEGSITNHHHHSDRHAHQHRRSGNIITTNSESSCCQEFPERTNDFDRNTHKYSVQDNDSLFNRYFFSYNLEPTIQRDATEQSSPKASSVVDSKADLDYSSVDADVTERSFLPVGGDTDQLQKDDPQEINQMDLMERAEKKFEEGMHT